jgi:predicted small lipoprotein YifL
MSRIAEPPRCWLGAVATRLALVLVVAFLAAGCGKKGDPVPPPDEPNTYPRTYPHA